MLELKPQLLGQVPEMNALVTAPRFHKPKHHNNFIQTPKLFAPHLPISKTILN